MANNAVGRAIEQQAFAVLETVKGTGVFPSAASELIVIAGSGEANQQPTYTDSEEINNSLDVLNRFRDQVGAGNWSMPIYLRPSGTAGTAPMGNVLFQSLMGLETIVGATSVTYEQALIKPSFTLWMRQGHTVRFGTGACAEACTFNFTNKGGAKADFTGGFMQMGWAGTGVLTAAVVSSTSVPVDDGKKFTAGAYVEIGADDNTGAGYKIESVTGDTLTMVDTIDAADEAVIKGFLPTYTPVGTPLENKDIVITLGAVTKPLKSLTVNYNSPVAWQTEEITTSGYVVEYVEDKRAITSTIDALFREDDLDYFFNGLAGTSIDMIAKIDDGAGKIFTLNLPYTKAEFPSVTVTMPTTSLSIPATSIGSVGEDSCTMVFT